MILYIIAQKSVFLKSVVLTLKSMCIVTLLSLRCGKWEAFVPPSEGGYLRRLSSQRDGEGNLKSSQSVSATACC